MKIEPLPERWRSAEPALRAVQLAFDVSEQVLNAVRNAAFTAGLSNSDQIRVVLGLPIARQAKRPRLTVSLSAADYTLLAKRYKLAAADHLRIKERVASELADFAAANEAVSHSTLAADSNSGSGRRRRHSPHLAEKT